MPSDCAALAQPAQGSLALGLDECSMHSDRAKHSEAMAQTVDAPWQREAVVIVEVAFKCLDRLIQQLYVCSSAEASE